MRWVVHQMNGEHGQIYDKLEELLVGQTDIKTQLKNVVETQKTGCPPFQSFKSKVDAYFKVASFFIGALVTLSIGLVIVVLT